MQKHSGIVDESLSKFLASGHPAASRCEREFHVLLMLIQTWTLKREGDPRSALHCACRDLQQRAKYKKNTKCFVESFFVGASRSSASLCPQRALQGLPPMPSQPAPEPPRRRLSPPGGRAQRESNRVSGQREGHRRTPGGRATGSAQVSPKGGPKRETLGRSQDVLGQDSGWASRAEA